tara:strand:- start:592 stop:762 length:171 start_codon:yes stop_codon:yes gene_type:complete
METIEELKERIQELEQKMKFVDEYLRTLTKDIVINGAVIHHPKNPYFQDNSIFSNK